MGRAGLGHVEKGRNKPLQVDGKSWPIWKEGRVSAHTARIDPDLTANLLSPPTPITTSSVKEKEKEVRNRKSDHGKTKRWLLFLPLSHPQ